MRGAAARLAVHASSGLSEGLPGRSVRSGAPCDILDDDVVEVPRGRDGRLGAVAVAAPRAKALPLVHVEIQSILKSPFPSLYTWAVTWHEVAAARGARPGYDLR